MKVELLYFHGCPGAQEARRALRHCLDQLGLPWEVTEVVGDHPSPTIRVGGRDVMGGTPPGGRSCRLDPPTERRIIAALQGMWEDRCPASAGD